MNLDYHFNIKIDGKVHSFDLKGSSNPSTSVVFGGNCYSVSIENPDDEKIVRFFLKHVRLSSTSSISDFVQYLKSQPTIQEVSFTTRERTHEVGKTILSPFMTKDSSSIEERKSQVQNHVMPRIPVLGRPMQATSIENRMRDLGVRGLSLAVVNGGEIEWSEGYGELNKPLLIQAASISKTVAALTVLSLIDQSQKASTVASPSGLVENAYIDLDTDVSPFLGEDLCHSIDPRHLSWSHQFQLKVKGSELAFALEKTTDLQEADLSVGGVHFTLKAQKPAERDVILSLVGQALPGAKTLTEWADKIRSMPHVDEVHFTSHEITIRRLLSHTAGTTVSGFDGYPRLDVITKEIADCEAQLKSLQGAHPPQAGEGHDKEIVRLTEQLINLRSLKEKGSKDQPRSTEAIIRGEGNSDAVTVDTPPGTAFNYSGGGTTILQRLVEVLTGKSFESAVDEHVFQKLEMKQSRYSPPEDQTIHGDDGDMHPIPGRWMKHPELAAAGLWTTPQDLAKVVLAIQNSYLHEAFLSQGLTKQMVTAQTPDVPNGLGVFVEKTAHATYFFHSGSNLGFRCMMVAHTNGQGAVLMTNSEHGEDLYEEVLTRIATVYKWPNWETLPMFKPLLSPEEEAAIAQPSTIDATTWKQYEGKYQFKEHSVEVFLQDGKMWVKIDRDEPFAITPVTDHLGVFQRIVPGPTRLIRFRTEEGKGLILTLFKEDHSKVRENVL